MANLHLAILLYSCPKTQILFVQTCIHYPDTISSLYTFFWPSPILPLGLDSDLWWEKLRRPGVRQEESPSVTGLNVLPAHSESGGLWGFVWILRCGKQRDRPSINNGPLYSDTSSERGSASDGHLPDLYMRRHECIEKHPSHRHTHTHRHTPKVLVHDTNVSYTWDHWAAAPETLHSYNWVAIEAQMCTLTMQSKSK